MSTASGGGAFSAGAARAQGERRRRAGTPLLADSSIEPVEVTPARRAHGEAPTAPATPTKTKAPATKKSTPKTPARKKSTPKTPPKSTPKAAPDDKATPKAKAAPDDTATPKAAPGSTTGSGHSTEKQRTRPSRSEILAARGERATARAARPGVNGPETTTSRGNLRALPTPPPDAPDLTDPRDGQEAEEVGTPPSPRASGLLPGPVSALQAVANRVVESILEVGERSSVATPEPTELVELAVDLLRAAATAAGVPGEDIEAHVADGLAYVRRRLSGEFEVDEFGFDEDYTRHIHLPLLRPLYRSWFRVEVRGIENIPMTGGALVVANHSGTVAMDSLMTQVAVHDEHPANRHLRMLGADLIFQSPFLGTMARRSGSTLAANSDAERLLSKGELIGVWPEGFKGVGKPFSERYKLQRFGRGGFVAAALRAEVPIIPCSIVGAEEIYPIIGNMPTVARLLGMPYAPITPTFPWLGPLGAIPLPSKWLIEFGAPIPTAELGAEAAEDPMLVIDLTDQVRETIQQTLYSLLMRRKSVFR